MCSDCVNNNRSQCVPIVNIVSCDCGQCVPIVNFIISDRGQCVLCKQWLSWLVCSNYELCVFLLLSVFRCSMLKIFVRCN